MVGQRAEVNRVINVVVMEKVFVMVRLFIFPHHSTAQVMRREDNLRIEGEFERPAAPCWERGERAEVGGIIIIIITTIIIIITITTFSFLMFTQIFILILTIIHMTTIHLIPLVARQ